METLKMWGMTLLISSFVLEIIFILRPGLKNEKMVRTAVSIFFICAIVSTIYNNNFDLSSELNVLESKYSNSSILESTINKATEENLKKAADIKLAEIAKKYSVLLPEYEIITDINEDNSILIKEIVFESEVSNEVIAEIKDELNTNARTKDETG